MRRIMIAAAVASMSALPALAQTATFKCAPAGTLIEYSDGSWTRWTGAQGNYCQLTNRMQNGNETNSDWYAPGGGRRSDQGTAWIDQVKPYNLWPLAVGKKVSARYTGPNTNGTGTGVWDFTITVDGYEKVVTKAGTFDAFVVTNRQEAISGNYKSTTKIWYAPDPGITAKFEFSDNYGGSRKAEAVAVKR